MARGDEGGDPDRVLAGIGPFTWKLLLGTAIAVGLAALGLRAFSGGSAPQGASPTTAERPADARSPSAAPSAARAATAPPAGTTAVAREVDGRHAAGGLSDAQRRFDPCPGGDVRRVAWIDGEGHVFRLSRQRADGYDVDEWFDDRGRVREALIRRSGSGGTWRWRAALDEDGRTSVLEEDGPVQDAPPPELVRTDPAAAFFATDAGCRPGGR